MKIIVLDGCPENPGDLSWGPLQALGELTVYDRTPTDDSREIIKRIGDAQVVITNKVPITGEILSACPCLQFISVMAAGYDVIDLNAAKKRGIPVSNVPGYGTAAVAQFAIALLLELCHHVAYHSETVHNGQWSRCLDWCYWDRPQTELQGKVMGIIGFGRIGRQTGRIAKALGMRILAYDRSPTPEGQEIADYVELGPLLEQSDVVVLHCPLLPETRGIINRDALRKMKRNAFLINNSRGPLVAEQDLADALNEGRLAGAGLDVVAIEPIQPDNPLLKAKNCLITPHISWAARESRQRILEQTVDNVRAFAAGTPRNVVDP